MAELTERPRSRAREIARNFFGHENAPLLFVLIALILIMGAITRGVTFSRVNVFNILLQSSIRGIAAIGQSMVILTAGIDISIGGNALFCSMLAAGLMTSGSLNIVGRPLPLVVVVAIMLLVGSGWGALNGAMVSRVGIPALISTLGLWQITTGAAYSLSGGRSFGEQPDALAWWGTGTIAAVPVPVIIFIVVAVVVYLALTHTTWGRSVYAVGGNPVGAWISGVNIKNILFSVYVISGFLAGLSGFIAVGRNMSASMNTLGGLMIDCIAAATIGGISLMGGRGNVIGVVMGALIIGVVNNGLSVTATGPDMVGVVKGTIIIVAVLVDYMRRRGG